MASYQVTRLSFTPALYWRLDMVGTAVDGDVIPDLSGNGLDGELNLLEGTNGGPGVSLGDGVVPFIYPYNNPSPIETDPASRAFAGHNWNISADTEQSRIFVSSDPLIEPTNDFTLDGWLWIPRADMGNDNSNGVLQQHLFGKFNVAEIYVHGSTKIGGAIKDSAGNFFYVAARDDFEIERWYYVALVRIGNALALYIDSVLQGTTTITSGLSASTATPDFQVHTSQIAPADCLYDEVAFQLNALSGPNIVTIYESAFNVLNMNGQVNIGTSAIISARDEPEPIAYPFRHNWDKPVVERLRWKSSVFKPVNGATELRRQRTAPRRQIEYQHLLYNEELSRRFTARAFGGRKSIVQFEPDKVRVGDLALGATSATFDTTYLDYEEGQYVLVYQDDDLWEHQLITAVTATGIEFDALSRAYTAPWLKPTRIARIPQSQQMVGETDNIGDASTQYDLLEEDEPLSPNRIIPYSPTLTYRGRDCWDLREWQGHDYNELPQWEWTADRSVLDEQTGVVSTKTYRWGADQIQPWNMNLQGRALIAKYLGWLYERAGQSSPFWMPTFRQDLKPLTVSGNVLIVKGHEYTNLYAAADNRLDLAFVYFDNTYAMRRIQSTTVDGENDVLELDTTVPTFSNLRWLSFLRRVILSSDDIELAWETDNVMRVAFAMIDAPLDWEAGSPSPSPSPSLSTSHSPSPSSSASGSRSPSGSVSPSASTSPSHSASPST